MCDDVGRDPTEVARAVVAGDQRDWQVLGVFVTSEPSPAARDSRNPFPFALLRDLERTIRHSVAGGRVPGKRESPPDTNRPR